MENFFKWFNGRKTAIGAALLFISKLLTETEIGAGEEWVMKLIAVLDYIGMAFTGIGLGHKGIKAMKK